MKVKHNMRVRKCLLENGFTHADLAAALHKARSTVSKWLSMRELSKEMQDTLISVIKQMAHEGENNNGK